MSSELEEKPSLLQANITFNYSKEEKENFEAELLPVFEWAKDVDSAKKTLTVHLIKEWAQEIVNKLSPLNKEPEYNYFILRIKK